MASAPRSSSSSSTVPASSGLSTSARFDKQQIPSPSRGGPSATHANARPKVPPARRSVTPNSRSRSSFDFDADSERVRVAVRVRPRNAEELLPDSNFVDYIELQPELNRLKLKKNNWSTEGYRFDEIFTEFASQKRVYEAVAKPVVESVLNGFNGTVMAYGQTGTGKTYTLGRLGYDDSSERGIMARAMEDLLSNITPIVDSVEISYLQLYMESVQDLLAPEKINIPINDDPKTGEVSLAGASVMKIEDLDHFLQLLQIGEANRYAANTKLNTESSRSHAILMIYVRRPVCEGNGIPMVRKSKLLLVDLAGSERIDKSGSEGHMLEEAKFINLSLTSLGKCINALAENSPHIPFRESKLTRLLRDSFGGSARTSLITTIGPSAQHQAETISTIMFGQRAIRIVNMVKVKEDFDYESLCRKLENQVDSLTAEIERQQKLRNDEKRHLEKQLRECSDNFAEAKKNLITRSELLQTENTRLEFEVKDILKDLNHQQDENELMIEKIEQLELSLSRSKQIQLESSTYQKVLADTTQMYEKRIAELIQQKKDEHARAKIAEEEKDAIQKLLNEDQKTIKQQEMENSRYQKALADATKMYENKVTELSKQLKVEKTCCEGLEEQLDSASKKLSDTQSSMQMQRKEMEELREKLQRTNQLHEQTLDDLRSLISQHKDLLDKEASLSEELVTMRQQLLLEEMQRKSVENELAKLTKALSEKENDFQEKKLYRKESKSGSPAFGSPTRLEKPLSARDNFSGQRATIAKICEEVGLQRILQLLTSEDQDVQIHAVKVVANLAAEDVNQERIVEEGGLDALLTLLQSSQNTTVLRVTSGAVANLAMNEMNQGLIISKGGAHLLAMTASKTNDSQTLRMVAGALANLCGNESLHAVIVDDGGIKALLGMDRCKSGDVIAQIARGIANFAKCETRGVIQGHWSGRSMLIDDGALTWLLANITTTSASTKRHIELALCHLAQNEENARDFISSGGVRELIRISTESTKEDIRNLAKKTLRNPTFQTEIQTRK